MKTVNDRAYERARIERERERIQFEADQQREAEERKAENAAARARYLAKLELEQEKKAKEREAKIDAELEPQKVKLCRQWLVDHLGQTEKDFELKAWPLLRANLLDDRRATQVAETREALMRTGNYSSF